MFQNLNLVFPTFDILSVDYSFTITVAIRQKSEHIMAAMEVLFPLHAYRNILSMNFHAQIPGSLYL